ncbi:DUF7563 family protein [Natronoarchaeum sp. GCM10025703]|uniref:DUF7563 family protein n=1 Tax=Natronoarchaeum sp. GCM10025703 TaxID=3252685 RepID=UPI00366F9790
MVVVLKLVDSDESPTCRNCGAHVSADFRRVYGDESDTVHRCRDCDTMRRLTRGSAAGLDLNIPDPSADGHHTGKAETGRSA